MAEEGQFSEENEPESSIYEKQNDASHTSSLAIMHNFRCQI